MFFLDILVIFNSAILDDDFQIIDDRCMIVKDYLSGWFIIDIVAILPFDLLTSGNGDATRMVRYARIGRVTKVLKLMKLMRLLKLQK